jgi:hypothetical protein
MNIESEEKKPKPEIEELEKEKLRLEIKELNKSWFEKPSYLQALLPTFILLVGLYFTWDSDLISVQREKNELKEMLLENSISKFETRKTELIDTLNFLKGTRDSLTDKVAYMQEYYNTEIMIKASEGGNLIEEIEDKKDRIRVLKTNLEKLEFNVKILKNAPVLNQFTTNALKVWEEKKMSEYTDSMFIKMSGSFFGSKKSIRIKGKQDSLSKEYSSIKPKGN